MHISPPAPGPDAIASVKIAIAEAERLGVPFLGEVPLALEIRETSDAGLPIVASAPGILDRLGRRSKTPNWCVTKKC